VLEKLHGSINRHLQNIVDALTLVPHFQRFAVIAFALALIAQHFYIWQEIHFDDFSATATTCFAPTAFYVETKSTGFVSADFCLRKIGE
jgi:hypothetical protein